MGARKRIWTPEIVRQRIRTSMLVHRLQKQALGKLELTDGEQRAIAILLKKVLPDLTACEYTAIDDTRTARDLDTDKLDRLIAALEREARPSSSIEEPRIVN
jgi:hypothetical protein